MATRRPRTRSARRAAGTRTASSSTSADGARLRRPAEPDRLLWFAGETPYPRLEGALDALAGAAEHGLDPDDYDATLLRERWTTIESGTASDPERALFDVALSVGVARFLADRMILPREQVETEFVQKPDLRAEMDGTVAVASRRA